MPLFEGYAYHGQDAALKDFVQALENMGLDIQALLALIPNSVVEPNNELFKAAKATDKNINERDVYVEQKVIEYISKFPTAGEELRFVVGVIKISALLERTADKIKNATKHLNRLQPNMHESLKKELLSAHAALNQMVTLAIQQVSAYTPANTVLLLQYGATVQRAYRKVVVLLHDLKEEGHLFVGEDDTSLLLIAKNLEQASDKLIEVMKIAHHIHLGVRYEKAQSL